MEAAFFDLDKTVIAKASMAALTKPFYKQGFLNRRVIIRSAWSHIVFMHLGADEQKLQRVRDNVLTLTRGWQQEHVRDLVSEVLDAVITPIVYNEARELIERHKREGRMIIIISASPEEIVQPLAESLGADHAIASRCRIDDDGRYTGEMEFFAQGPAKAHAIERMAYTSDIDLQNSFAYSDSFTDKPMLESVGNPVAVNPDRALARLAAQRNWPIHNFDHPVPMRERAVAKQVVDNKPKWIAALAIAFVLWRLKRRIRDRR